jgi:hypothetical protein
MQRLSVRLSRGEIAGAMRIVFGGKIINDDRSRLALLACICMAETLSSLPASCAISQPCGYVIKIRVCFAF